MSQQLWELLTSKNLTNGNKPKIFELESPWYIKLIQAFSGWLAALFILGLFSALFSRLFSNIPAMLIIGFGLIVGALILLNTKKGEFLEHLGLAISLAGQVLIVIAIEKIFGWRNEATLWFFIALIQLPLLLLMPNYVHRVFSSFIAAIGFGIALYHFQESLSGPYVYGALLMILTVIIWLNEFSFPKHIKKLQAIGYGLVFALITLKGTNTFMRSQTFKNQKVENFNGITWFQPWMGELLLSMVVLYLVWKLLQKTEPKPHTKTIILALLATLIIALLSTQAQGLIIGIMIVLLGFSASNRVLMGLGTASLLFFISSYYYLLENTLMEKSITLLILGIALMLARLILIAQPSEHMKASDS